MANPANVRLALLSAYSIGLIAVGLWIGRRVRTSSDFFVAGRRLSPVLLFASVLSANIGAGTTVGAAGLAYRDGISGWWWNGSAAMGTMVLGIWIGPRLWHLAAKHELYTLGDFLELRYGSSVRAVIAALIGLGSLSILAAQLQAGAAVLRVAANVPDGWGVLIGGLLMTLYFVAGGLLSSAWVNAVQLLVILLSFAIAVPLVLANIGGLAALAGSAHPGSYSDIFFSSGRSSGWTLLALLGPAFVVSPGLIQKSYGASTPRTVRVGLVAAALAQAVFGLAPALLGMAARTVQTHDFSNLNRVLPAVLMEQLPSPIGALGLAAIFTAEVSTCDAILFMLSTSLSKDLYKRFFAPQASDTQLLRVARVTAIAGGAGSIFVACQLQSIIQALGIFYSLLGVSLFVPVVGGLFIARADTRHAHCAIFVGMLTLVATYALPSKPVVVWGDPALFGMAASTIAFVASLVLLPASRRASL